MQQGAPLWKQRTPLWPPSPALLEATRGLQPSHLSSPRPSPAQEREHLHHRSSSSSPRCQYQQRNQRQETIALLFPSGMTDPY